MPKPTPLKRSTDGRNYLCARDDAVIPDGCLVQAQYSGSTLVGVRAIYNGTGSPGAVAHSCGTVNTLTTKWGAGQTDG